MNLKDTISKFAGNTGLKIEKHSPEILLAAGIVGTVATVIFACKSTLRVNEVLDDSKKEIEKVHEVIEREDISEEEYSEEDAKKDLATIYVQTGVKLVKLYAPAIIFGATSIICLLASSNILHKRNIALAAAYTAVEGSYKKYRQGVIERFGEQVDKEIKYNLKAIDVTEKEIDKKGKEKEVTKKVLVSDNPSDYSPYARFFDEGSACWKKDPEYNLMYLRAQQQYANDLLISRGHLFLNEVYDMLDIPRTKAGQVVGWFYDAENPVGDNYVDFGIYDINREVARDFVNGYERSILLDFNVDGNIWDRI